MVAQSALLAKFNPTVQDEKLILKMKNATSSNLLKFYGFCPMDTAMGVVCEIASRGSVATIMREQTIRVDAIIKNSIISDLTNALSYLHGSSIEYHGALSRENCLLDNRLVLQVAYFRLDILPRPQPDFNQRSSANNVFITFAPEQLRNTVNIYQGSREADIYSYGHVMAELLCEIEPFQTEIEIADYSAEEIIEMIRHEGRTPFRPKIPLYNVLPKFTELIDRCWEEKPAARPSIQQISYQLKSIPGFEREYNLVEELLKRLNAHADALEIRIQSATQGATEEKKRAEELLLQMLPKHVVSALKKGIRIDPEGFNSATVGFTALENFGLIVATSTPLQIVAILNDLYSMFDATLPRFDVYKVETISDSYMIASGVPVRNGQQHSREIASLALELMKEAETFPPTCTGMLDGKDKLPAGNTIQLLMKIGIHTGSCVAGVIGQRMPRYCLFGDTINTASRMTSFGQAMKIQISAEGREHLLRNWGKFRFQFRGVIDIKVLSHATGCYPNWDRKCRFSCTTSGRAQAGQKFLWTTFTLPPKPVI
ncbi:atrial natriuretic peptide receptor 1-like isoform X4 [Paramacrobiotus metropolitanus]|uniref:atrial natriuretic peptide receptor 1-like isoform X4 n=1 Tax=Paramacrobiotus metropolitanus TaxID=2943436 RepID=UPI002445A104|nr:atrial natriuretic peptide receptor 1-like isoform X4 [Paramacrobiotus metropolitanus]